MSSTPINRHRPVTGQSFPQPCPHLADFKSRHESKPFRGLQDCIRVKPPVGRAAIRRDQNEVPRCGLCGESARPRLYACVTCAVVSCHSLIGPSHAATHAESMPPGHEIAIDVDRAELFCCVCRDQVYDQDFDATVVLAHTDACTLGGSSASCSQQLENIRKRRRADYRPWRPNSEEQMWMGSCSSSLDSEISDSDVPKGLRGLNNMGNTCFLNSVLQALLHTPPLRNYFLSDRHNRYICQQKNKKNVGSSDGNSNKNAQLCLACDMDAMFSAVFSGDQIPYSPAKFLYSWWQHAANLASYEQQDAHEFFISMLEAIHEKTRKIGSRPQSQGSGDCCIAHRVFSGILRSDVMCMTCGFTSTTYDPCVNISLDLELNQGVSAKISPSKHHSCRGDVDCKCQNCGISTLIGCLDRFTRPERLGSDQKFFCQQCQVKQESLKQMSIRKLPLVSCFHIKRFEHSSVRRMSRKINSYLQFPFSLNMSPYHSSSILRTRYGNRIFPFDGDESGATNELSSEFELFAVVTHSGRLDAGHYVTYVRISNQWYKCDDAWTTRVNENTVRAAQGYMIFYVQKMLFYKASEKQIP